MNNIKFFPSDKQFWLFNFSGWLTLFVVFVALKVAFDQMVLFNIIGISIIIIYGVFSGLIFRWYVRSKIYQQSKLIILILCAFIYSLMTSFFGGILIALYERFALHFFYPEKISEILQYHSLLIQFIQTTIGNSFFIFSMLCIWCFLYIAISLYRRSHIAEDKAIALSHSLKTSQMNVLSGQLNPHFLFNALNNLRFMMHKNIDKAEDMLIDLSDILRYTLHQGSKEKVTIKQELEIVERYLSILKIQYGDKLTIKKQCNICDEHTEIPPLFLQLLVENAIKHGIEKRQNGGIISINVEQNKQNLVIDVKNDLAITNEKNEKNENSIGVGISNIENRLTLLYGNKAGFIQEYIDNNKQFHAQITIPLEPLR